MTNIRQTACDPAWRPQGSDVAEFIAFRCEVFGRVHGLVGVDQCPGVAGHAAHDGQQRAVGHVDAVVDGLARADGGEQFLVLDVVHARLGPVVLPLARRLPLIEFQDLRRPLVPKT